MHITLGQQLGRNAEAYVDDIVVKSREPRTLVEDLEETFAHLRKVNLRLNPEKCVFGVPFGKLVGFLVLHRGIEANLEKVEAIERKGHFERTTEAKAAFQDLKRYLMSPPVMVAPRPLEPLVLYVAATPHSASAALVAVREERAGAGALCSAPRIAAPLPPYDGAPEASTTPSDGKTPEAPSSQAERDLVNTSSLVDHPVYFVSIVLRDARSRYAMPQKLLLVVLVASRKLRHYFQGHPIKVVSAYPLEKLEFSTARVIKGAALAYFLAEWKDAPDQGMSEDRSLVLGDEARDGWVMYFDGARTYGEKVSNNITEYEGLIAGLKAAAAPGVKRLTVKGHSQLRINFSNKEYKPKDEHMEAYCYLLSLQTQEGCWTQEFKAYLLRGTLPEKEEDAERVARKATAYCLQDGELYRRRPNDVSLQCISKEQGRELLADIHGRDCGHDSSSRTLVGKVFRSGFYWPMALNDATELVRSCEACQFHAKQIHHTAQGLQTISLMCPFAAEVVHPWSNSQAERANAEVLTGLKTRNFKKKLEACGRGWLGELHSVLWSIRTTATKPTGETSFFIVYVAEAVLTHEVKHLSPWAWRLTRHARTPRRG
ncbi:uncharacterized protein [Aegilops tauschii subsp. strangulata]|uniref:uncharacterized protein n=1 Tax=Aegilops tauschii subsp. strangulata TaxID=200361 RepID=UPI00098AAB17|nr:uncharacterized protein LOC123494516 [Aegilops tauschii subsp. strangulata]